MVLKKKIFKQKRSECPFKVRLDWTRSEGWQPSPTSSRVVDYVTREGCQPSQAVANLRDWSLHGLILITFF